MTTPELALAPPTPFPPFEWETVYETDDSHHWQRMRRARLAAGWLYCYESHAHQYAIPSQIHSGDSSMVYVPDK